MSRMIRFLVVTQIVSLFLIVEANEDPLQREWTSKAGSKITATLVKWSDFDVTLKRADGKEMVVKLDQITGGDISYLQDFRDLKEIKKPEKLPWVDVDAIVKSRSRDTYYNIFGNRFDAREIKMMVDIDNHSDQALEVDVIWMFFADDVSSRIQLKSAENMYPFNVERAKMTLEPRGDITFETAKARKTAMGYGQKYKGGSKIKGFVVQVYWNDWLLKGFANHHSLSKVAADEGLMKSLKGN